MKKRLLAIALIATIACSLTGCLEEEKAPVEENLDVLTTIKGSTLEQEHDIEGFKFVTTYDTGDYDLSRWRVTDTKTINMSAVTENLPDGTEVFIEHVHIDMALKSTNPQLDGLAQDSMDDSFHGVSQDGFFINDDYSYENKFAIEGFSKDIIDGWMFVCGTYGSGSITQERLTEKNLVEYGDVYANKMQVVYDILIKNEGEKYYHVVSISDEFLIPVAYKPAN